MAHRLAPEVEGDLDAIWYYIAKESGSIEIADVRLTVSPKPFIAWQPTPILAVAVMKICAPVCAVLR